MKKLTLLALLALTTLAVPLQASSRGKHQSYFSYDDGGTIIRQDDGREVDARVNQPLFPGDEVITNRRGRAEVRLSDGNVVGLDRATAVNFRSVLDSYDGEGSQTVAELRYGKVIVHRTDEGREYVRLDTDNATYVAVDEAIYSVETEARGADRVVVFDGSIEVRTPSRNTRIRAGETASIDDRGLYGLVTDSRASADDFERWFIRRAERYGRSNSRYLDRSLGYADADLTDHGTWIYVSGYGNVWRPHVGAGWRPYYHGHWVTGRNGCLVWVSYESWGWVPYHYGRWAHDPGYGWVWLPGTGYAPAWVYWMYGPSYIGWAPSGWYDCYRPYYNWAYRPYSRAHAEFGFGFYGRVRVSEVDLRPWTFIDSNTIVSNRVDRAALTTDAVRERLQRNGGSNGGGFVTVASGAQRFTREEFRDPAAAINRRVIGSGTGKETGSPADVTPFFRRDPELAGNVRDRIVRGTASTPSTTPGTVTARGTGDNIPRGGLAPIAGGSSVAPIGSGNVAPIGSGNVAPIGGGNIAPTTRGDGGRVNRGDWRNESPAPAAPATPSDRGAGARIGRGSDTPSGSGSIDRNRDTGSDTPSTRDSGSSNSGGLGWRNRVVRPETPATGSSPNDASRESAGTAPAPAPAPARDSDSWRGRISRGSSSGSSGDTATPRAAEPRDSGSSRGSDVPRRVIDGIGGARVSPDRGSRDSGSRDSGSRDSGSSRSRESAPPPPRVERSSPPPRQEAPPPPRQEAPRNSGGDEGGKIKRDQ